MAVRKVKRWIRSETNRAVYNKVRKAYLDHKGEINCTYCPYHRGENWERHDHRCWKNLNRNGKRWMKDRRSWKNRTTQYYVKEIE